jgi:hypothetical protein
MTDKEYKQKVENAKKIVTQMINAGKEKDIPVYEIEEDIETYLKKQNLTSFDLKTDGNRKDASYVQAFTHGFNTNLKKILNVVVPELASALDLKKFGIWDVDELLERDETVRAATKEIINDIFTTEILPGQRPFIELGFTPETLGEKMADRAGADIINLLGLVAAPQVAVGSGPATAFTNTFANNPTKLGSFYNAIQNSIKTILRQYRDNPGKSFTTDIAATIGFSTAAELGETMTQAARENESEGYYDTGIIEPTFGLLGAGGAAVIAQTAMGLGQTKKALSTIFTSWGGLKPLLNSFTTGSKLKQKKAVANQIKKTLQESEKQLNISREIEDLTETATGQKIKLTTAEQTESPSLITTQENVEANILNEELNQAVKRRIENLNILDESLETQIPSVDKDVNYIIDLKQNKMSNLQKQTTETLEAAQAKLLEEQPVLDLSKAESGKNLRNSIETAQSAASSNVQSTLNKLPAATQEVDGSVLTDIAAKTSRTFETGTEPQVVGKINKLIQQYLPTKTLVDDIDDLGKTVTREEIIPPEKVLTNQDLLDIWMSASIEEAALLGKTGIQNAKKLTKIVEIKKLIKDQLEENINRRFGKAGDEGVENFWKSFDDYVAKFEKGTIVDARKQNAAGFQFRDEKVADAFFQTENVGAMDDFIRIFKDDPDAIFNMEQAILDRVINRSLNQKTGLLDMDKFRIFLNQYKSVLDRFGTVSPKFIEMIRNKPSALDNITKRILQLDKRKNFLNGEKLKEVFTVLGAPGTKQLKFGSSQEYVQAALKDEKVMNQIITQINNQFPDAGDAWIKSVLDEFITLRIDNKTGAIGNRELKNLQNFLKDNEKTLSIMFNGLKGDKVGKEHLKNLNLIVKGYEKVALVSPPKGSPAATPDVVMKDTLGVDIPQVWSRAFAVQSGRTGVKFTVLETFNRFLNNIGRKEFNKVLKQAIYDPDFAKTLAGMTTGKEATVKDLKNLYGFLGKINGIIGIESEHGEEYNYTDEAEVGALKKIQNMAPTPNISFDQPTVAPESRLSEINIANPVGMRGSPIQSSPIQMANTYERGQQLFNKPGEITFAAKGGIMSTNKAFQRVA